MPDSVSDPTRATTARRTGHHNVIAACIVGVVGNALIAAVFGSLWLAAVILASASVGVLCGMHIRAQQEIDVQESRNARR